MKNFPVQYILFLLLLSHLGLFAQNHVPVVTNVDLQQRTDYTLIVDIYYDVFDADEDTMTVTMFASSDSGATWNLTCNNITGAIGSGITNGTGKHIIWNIGVEHPNFFSNKVMIEIAADDGVPSAPLLVSPQNNFVIIQLDPILKWNASVNASGYILQVSEDSLFNTYVFNQSGLIDTSQQIIGLNDSTTYFWRASSTSNLGISGFSSTWSFSTAAKICPGLPNVTYSGKTYNTVKVGTQCWLRENLDVGVYVASINTGSVHSDVSNNGIIEKYCYENDELNCATYGGLYDWNEAMGYGTTAGAQGICPTGWHIPTFAEFETLLAAVNEDGNSLKAIGQGTGAGAGTNTSVFSALLANTRYPKGGFSELGQGTIFWSSTGDSGYARHIGLRYDSSSYSVNPVYQEGGYSVRCLKD